MWENQDTYRTGGSAGSTKNLFAGSLYAQVLSLISQKVSVNNCSGKAIRFHYSRLPLAQVTPTVCKHLGSVEITQSQHICNYLPLITLKCHLHSVKHQPITGSTIPLHLGQCVENMRDAVCRSPHRRCNALPVPL